MREPSPRLLHLRRPPVLQVQDEPFVPERGSLDEVDARWAALRARNSAYFDGRVYHVLGVHRNGHGGAVLHVQDAAYRFYAVQSGGFDLGVRPLGVKGLTTRGSKVLLGRRSAFVAKYPGAWEFAPGGGVDAGTEPARAIVDELREETGLVPDHEPIAIAVTYDPGAQTWEVIYRIVSHDGTPACRTGEYEELRWCGHDGLPGNLSPIAERLVGLL